MTNLRKLLAANIKQHRRILGITQSMLATKANTSTQYVAMIELGKKFPSPEVLERIALALGIDTSELFLLPSSPVISLLELHETVLTDISEVAASGLQEIEANIQQVITKKLEELRTVTEEVC
jgi:transcriptional regulator with XRE-family HTH domain